MRTAFVLGGGGKWGAVQVGMLDALAGRGVRPDLVLGCSIGAINGAVFAADPTPAGVDRMCRYWTEEAHEAVVDVRLRDRVHSFVGRRPYLYETRHLHDAIVGLLADATTFDRLAVPFQCVAACIETASEQWFESGRLVDALLASAAIPGLFPPAAVDGTHYYDGGLVNSIPIDRAVALGATRVFVLQVGRAEQPLQAPHRLWEAPLVAFEIARRHRFATFLDGLPGDVEVHVLPTGNPIGMKDRRQLAWRRVEDAPALIAQARVATAAYLEALTAQGATW